jgi:hypothetical protein
MRKHHVATHVAVRITLRMGVAGTGRCQCLETESLQVARASDIPRIWNDETAALVQRTECAAFFGGTHEMILSTVGLRHSSNRAMIAMRDLLAAMQAAIDRSR